jgi:excisionase family DNA binding protein
MDIERPLTVKQTAQALGVSRAHIYALIRRNQFPVVRFGNLTRVSQQTLRDFLASGGTAPKRKCSDE